MLHLAAQVAVTTSITDPRNDMEINVIGTFNVLEAVRPDVHVSKAAQALIDAVNDNLVELTLHEPCKLVHLRSHDTHGAFVFPAGEYIRGLREEQSPEGWRRVAD